jgi:Domain of unknown function (DUF4397)
VLQTFVRRFAAAIVTALVTFVGAGLTTVQAHATSSEGWIRLAHFSPDTDQVDIYVSSFGRPGDPTVLKSVGYGAVSPYQRVEAGSYAVAMRPAGAPESQQPVISTTIQVAAGAAYTVAGMGRKADLKLVSLQDDLSTPAKGQIKMRVINAAMGVPTVDAVEVDDQKLAQGLRFGESAPYAPVAAGDATVRVGSVVHKENFMEGGTCTLVIKDVSGGIDFFFLHDSAAVRNVPRGGVDAGLGGADQAGAPWLLGAAAAIVGLGLAWTFDPHRRATRTRG